MLKKIIPRLIMNAYYYAMEFFAAARYGFPGEKLQAIGVTGTKGKSTTVFLITRILEAAGFRVASTSSIEFRINQKSTPNKLKMGLLSRWKLQEFLAEASKKNVDYVVIECTSEGLAQARVDFVHFIAAVFTNLAPEHIESHGSYEQYRRAKRHLFELVDKDGIGIINGDDKEGEYMASALKGKTLFYSLGDKHITTPLIGEFNKYNALAALTLCASLGVEEGIIKKALMEIDIIPGRAQEIKEGQDFRVFIDYAHNPSSLEAILRALTELKKENSRLIVLTGSAGGGRDTWKRPEMGALSARFADAVIITSEDSFNENPETIIDQIYAGAIKEHNKKNIVKIVNRKEAIAYALKQAKKGDIVLIAGMGTETSLSTLQGEIPWNEREMVKNLLIH